MNRTLLQRIVFTLLISMGLFQATACDQLKGILDGCSASSENGSTDISCNPNNNNGSGGSEEP